MGSMFRTPRAPDPINVGQVTQQANQQNTSNAYQNASFNRVNQTGPYGSVNYRQTGTDERGNPIFEQQTTLDPREMQFRQQGQDAFGGALGGLEDFAQMNRGMQLNRVSDDPEGLMQMGADRLQGMGTPGDLNSTGALNRAYDMATSFSEPRMQRQMEAERTRLSNMGLDPSSEAYRNSMRDLNENQSSARNTLTAALQGQMFNQGLAGRQNEFSEATGLMGLGANRAGQLFGQDQAIAGLGLEGQRALGGMGLQGVAGSMTRPDMQGYAQTGVQNVDVAGLANQAQQQAYQNYQSQMQQRNAMLGGLASIAGSFMGPMGSAVAGRMFPRPAG